MRSPHRLCFVWVGEYGFRRGSQARRKLRTEIIRKAKHNRGQGPPVHVKGRVIGKSGLERPYACMSVQFKFNFISYEEQLKLFDVIKAVC